MPHPGKNCQDAPVPLAAEYALVKMGCGHRVSTPLPVESGERARKVAFLEQSGRCRSCELRGGR